MLFPKGLKKTLREQHKGITLPRIMVYMQLIDADKQQFYIGKGK
jgi:hypothetical protein